MDNNTENKEGLFRTFLRSFHESFSKDEPQKTADLLLWKDFMQNMSDMIDEKIISYCQEKKCSYISGKCTFTGTTDESEFNKVTLLNVDAILYFTSQNKNKAIRLPLHTERFYSDFNIEDEETLNSLRNVLKEQFIIDIAAPKDIKNGKE